MSRRCIRLNISGMVQGVGFRPYSARLAQRSGLQGWVRNSANGVIVEVEGVERSVDTFVQKLGKNLPPLARIDSVSISDQRIVNYNEFRITNSEEGGVVNALVSPDAATCQTCLAEMLDTKNRRYRYPFICCTECGPRYSVVESLPYDRNTTTLAGFKLCDACQKEYSTEDDRRYHAQAIACPDCGPRVRLLDSRLNTSHENDEALLQAAAAIRNGYIVAVKGLGGFQLLVDARNESAVSQLRMRKQRPHKPFAIMLSALSDIELWCELSSPERQALQSAQSPIVLLQRKQLLDRASASRSTIHVADSVAPDSLLMGCMLPHTPIHHLLLRELGFPVVATSGNAAGQPLVSDESQLDCISTLADMFLVHDRPIACALDDSVVRVIAGRPLLIRAARGFSPIVLSAWQSDELPKERTHPTVLALGGQQKSTIAIADEQRITVGPYRGDLVSVESRLAFHQNVDAFTNLHHAAPTMIACDLHPDYYTTQISGQHGVPVIRVQHHVAHVLACMADNALDGPVLGIAWDGTGYGVGDVIRGGEFMLVEGADVFDIASLWTFALPGAERSIVEPRRAALGAVYELFGDAVFADKSIACMKEFSAPELALLQQMLSKAIHSPRTSSAGRLFDAVASLLALVQQASFEGQAAMAVEQAALVASREVGVIDDPHYALIYSSPVLESASETTGILRASATLDWRPMLMALLDDLRQGVPVSHIAMKTHTALADGIVNVARQANIARVVLTGGCMQNKLLTELTVLRLQNSGFSVFWHKNLPANDGSLSVGQALWAQRRNSNNYLAEEVSCA